MPIYLVRWPNLSAALVSAEDEDDLLDTLDQLADTEGARWEKYRGPLWVEFDLPVKTKIPPADEEQAGSAAVETSRIEFDHADVYRLAGGSMPLELSVPTADTGFDMVDHIYQRAFPHLYKAVTKTWASEDAADRGIDRALRKELELLIQARWRIKARGRATDEWSQLATFMRAPVRVVKAYARLAGHDTGPEPEAPRKPAKPIPLPTQPRAPKKPKPPRA